MFLWNALRGGLLGSAARRGGCQRRPDPQRRTAQLMIESLEERSLLSYSFTLIADNSGPYLIESLFPQPPRLNGGGTVSFAATLKGGSAAVFTGSGGELTTIADSYGDFIPFGGTTLNAHGLVVFGATLREGGSAKVAGDGGPYITIADTRSGVFSNLLRSHQVNDSGMVALRADLTDGSQRVLTGRAADVQSRYGQEASFSPCFPSPPLPRPRHHPARDPSLRAASRRTLPAGEDHPVRLVRLRHTAPGQRRGLAGRHAGGQSRHPGRAHSHGLSGPFPHGFARAHAGEAAPADRRRQPVFARHHGARQGAVCKRKRGNG